MKRNWYLAVINQYTEKGWTLIYTEACVLGPPAAAGAGVLTTVEGSFKLFSKALGPQPSTADAETAAIQYKLEIAEQNKILPPIVLLTDSAAAL